MIPRSSCPDLEANDPNHFGLPWALAEESPLARRAYVWSTLFMSTGALSMMSAEPLYLVAAFCAAFAGMLDIWMARAHVASASLRSQLEDRAR